MNNALLFIVGLILIVTMIAAVYFDLAGYAALFGFGVGTFLERLPSLKSSRSSAG